MCIYVHIRVHIHIKVIFENIIIYLLVEKHFEKKEETDYYIGDHCSTDHFGRCGSTKKSQ